MPLSVPLQEDRNLREEEEKRPPVLTFLPLRLSCKENSTFSSSPSSMVFTPPSVPPFPGDRNLRKRGCNRPTVLFFRKSPRPSLPLKRAPPLNSVFSPQGRRGKPLLLVARNRYALRMAGHQSPRHVVRDGTAWG